MSKFKARLFVFDLDGTLTTIKSPWQMIHEKFGVWEKAIVYHDSFFRGEIDYDTWCKKDSSLWENRSFEEIRNLIDSIEPSIEALEVLKTIAEHRNTKMMILSSGFVHVARKIVKMAGIEERRITIIANDIQHKNGKLVGVPKVKLGSNDSGKSAHIKRFLDANNILPELAVAVDDRAQDKDKYKKFGAFIHITTPKDLYKTLDYL